MIRHADMFAKTVYTGAIMTPGVEWKVKTRLVLIECLRNNDGVFMHHAYEGKRRVISAGLTGIITDVYDLNMLRTFPDKFLRDYK